MIMRLLESVADHSVDTGTSLTTDVRLDEAVALRRCAMYRTAFRGAAVGYPAEVIRRDALAAWMRRQGVTVDVSGVDELDCAVIAGIRPSHIVVHGFNETSGPIALDYGVGRVIVGSAEQLAIVCASATQPRGVLLDVTDGWADDPATLGRRLRFDGLHYRADGADIAEVSDILFGMIAEMALISRKWGAVVSRLSVGGVDLTDYDGDPRTLRRAAQAIDGVVEEACMRFRYPRPALTLSPEPRTLLRTA